MYPTIENLTIETSSICNAKCKICPNFDKPRLPHLMPLKDFENTLKRFTNLTSMSLCGCYEPLLDKRLPEIFSIIKKIHPNIKITIFTNGSNLKNNENLLLNCENLKSIIFSIHGFSIKVYNTLMINLDRDTTYNNIIKFIKFKNNYRSDIHNNPLKIAVSFVRTSENLYEWIDFKNYWKNKVDDVHNFELMNWNSKVTNYENLIDKTKLQSRECPMYENPMVIDAFGNIIRCCYNTDFNYGHVFKDGVKNYLNKKRVSNTYPDFDCIKCDGWKI